MASKITRLVKDDYGGYWAADLTDKETGLPIDLTNAVGANMYIRAKGTTAVLESVVLSIEAPATSGRVSVNWPVGVWANPPGHYEGEIVITLGAGGSQTVYDLAKFYLREDVGP